MLLVCGIGVVFQIVSCWFRVDVWLYGVATGGNAPRTERAQDREKSRFCLALTVNGLGPSGRQIFVTGIRNVGFPSTHRLQVEMNKVWSLLHSKIWTAVPHCKHYVRGVHLPREERVSTEKNLVFDWLTR